MRKLSRTISGVTPVAVMAEPRPCPGQCVYCPGFPDAPKSYTVESPAVLRARRCAYDPARQVTERLRIIADMGHPGDKVELIIMGGTFLAYPEDYQHNFVKACYDALNGFPSADLEEAKKANETTAHRCVGLCIETRPDFCADSDIQRMLSFGATRVELGVQTLDDRVYELVRRGHTVADVRAASKRLRDRGFKVYYHWMPGLPGMMPERDLELSRLLFEDEGFRPDGLKLYPTLVVTGSEMESWYRQGDYRPYPVAEMLDLLCRIKAFVPGYVRIPRLMRDIPAKFIIAGCRDSSLRQLVKQRMGSLGLECRCIRCREYGHRLKEGRKIGAPQLVRHDYRAAGGKEICLSLEDDRETLFGLLRLRAVDGERHSTVRELHVYGPEVPLGQRQPGAAQHHGLGRQLLQEAERIAWQDLGLPAIRVLSGVGARHYYQSAGYRLSGFYMEKQLGTGPSNERPGEPAPVCAPSP